MDKAEHVCEVGYINDEMKHVLISIQHPTLTNVYPKPSCIQVALTIDSAIVLRAELNAFLAQHGILPQ